MRRAAAALAATEGEKYGEKDFGLTTRDVPTLCCVSRLHRAITHNISPKFKDLTGILQVGKEMHQAASTWPLQKG